MTSKGAAVLDQQVVAKLVHLHCQTPWANFFGNPQTCTTQCAARCAWQAAAQLPV